MGTFLKNYSEREKTAYLEAIASLAAANRAVSAEELSYLRVLAQEANLPLNRQTNIIKAAKESSARHLIVALNILKKSRLRFSLITDLIHFAESDEEYTDEEKRNIEKIAIYLHINANQLATLNQFVKKSTERHVTPQRLCEPDFLLSLGLNEQFKSAGINTNSVTQGLMATIGTMVLAKVLGGNRSSNAGMPGLASGGVGAMVSKLNEKKAKGLLRGLLSKFSDCFSSKLLSFKKIESHF